MTDETDMLQEKENKLFEEEYAKTTYTPKPEKTTPPVEMMRLQQKLARQRA